MDDILKRLEKLENITSFEYFTGIGFDSHRFDPSKMGIVLGGVNIPYEKGFHAHSDGDVFFHAVIDSLLGASSLGDIGTLFPDTDPNYKGISKRDIVNKKIGRVLYWANIVKRLPNAKERRNALGRYVFFLRKHNNFKRITHF